jgi:hypothetical protein
VEQYGHQDHEEECDEHGGGARREGGRQPGVLVVPGHSVTQDGRSRYRDHGRNEADVESSGSVKLLDDRPTTAFGSSYRWECCSKCRAYKSEIEACLQTKAFMRNNLERFEVRRSTETKAGAWRMAYVALSRTRLWLCWCCP